MSNKSDFVIFCPDGFNPEYQLVSISDGNHAKTVLKGTGLDLLALYQEITEAMLKSDLPFEMLVVAIVNAIQEARKAGVKVDLEESFRRAMRAFPEEEVE